MPMMKMMMLVRHIIKIIINTSNWQQYNGWSNLMTRIMKMNNKKIRKNSEKVKLERKEIWWIYCYCQQSSTPSYTTYWISFVINRFGFYFSNLFLTFSFNSIICPYSLENKLLLRDAELTSGWLRLNLNDRMTMTDSIVCMLLSIRWCLFNT